MLKLVLDETVVKVSHKGNTIEWNAKAFKLSDRTREFQRADDPDVPQDDPFDQLNLYLNYLSEEKQDLLFEQYVAAHNVFMNSSGDMAHLIQSLTSVVKEIWKICPIADIAYWVKSMSTIRIPTEAKVFHTMEENAKNGELYGSNNWPRESTYLVEDYWNLIYLIAALRLLYPIWGTFVLHADGEVGNTLKYFYALKIITSTSIVECEGYKQMQRYLKHHLVLDNDLDRNTFNGGVSTADFPEWITSMVLVRKFSQFNYSGSNSKFNMVATFFKYVEGLVNSLTSHLKRVIQPKIHEGSAFQGDQEKRPDSPFEMVKIKEEIPIGDIVIMNECALDVETIAYRLCPDLPPELLAEAVHVANNVWMDIMFDQNQITILQWVMGKEYIQHDGEWDVVFQPRAVDELERDGNISLMAAAAAALWHRGYHDLAALMTAKRIDPRDTIQMLRPETPLPWNKEIKEKLAELYPHVPRPTGNKRDTTKKMPPGIIDDIDTIRENFSLCNWNLTLPKSWLDKSSLTRGNRRYVVKANFRNNLAELSIAIASRTF